MATLWGQQGVLLFGGHHGDLYYNDLWLWNGREWQPQAPNDTAGTAPESRAYHGATYDESLEQMVISGGTNEDEKIATTWAWHGGEQRWTKYYAKPEFPLNNLTSLEYDPIQNQLVGIGAELFQADDASVRLGSMMLTHKLREEPISTMSYLVPDALYQHEVLYLRGRGAVVNESRTIQKHQWTTTSNGIVTVLGNEPDFDMRAESLPLGSQVIGYAVQDDLGNWSVQQVGEITVQESERFYFPIIMR